MVGPPEGVGAVGGLNDAENDFIGGVVILDGLEPRRVGGALIQRPGVEIAGALGAIAESVSAQESPATAARATTPLVVGLLGDPRAGIEAIVDHVGVSSQVAVGHGAGGVQAATA